MATPYDHLEARGYWRSAVAACGARGMLDLYRPKFAITRSTKLATAGSCFAQNLRRALEQRSYTIVDAEPSPPGLSVSEAGRFGFGQFSARFGNIYTVRQLRELLEEAYGQKSDAPIWEKAGRFFDALRPAVEPLGHADPETVRRHRNQHLSCVCRMVGDADVFVFTLGLTEAWIDRKTGRAVPTAPGVIAGSYDPALAYFVNFTVQEVLDDLRAVRALLTERNPNLRMLLTVSPVPLTATASGQHILVATQLSKSVLRAAAGQIADQHQDVDYFPSYEIVTNCYSGELLYEPNLRSVNPAGIALVMDTFFSAIEGEPKEEATRTALADMKGKQEEDAVCEDALLDAFAR